MSIDTFAIIAGVAEPLEWVEARPPVHLGLEEALLHLEPTQLWRLSYSQTPRGVSAVGVADADGRCFMEAQDRLGGFAVLGGIDSHARALIVSEETARLLRPADTDGPPDGLRQRRKLTGMTLARPRLPARGRRAEARDVASLVEADLPALVDAGPAPREWSRWVAAGAVVLEEVAGALLAVIVLGWETRRYRPLRLVLAARGRHGAESAAAATSLLFYGGQADKPLHVSIEAGDREAARWADRCGFSAVGAAIEYGFTRPEPPASSPAAPPTAPASGA